jgi:hypothetical protein
MMAQDVRLGAADGSFVVDGRRSFLLADTVWSALSDATDDEWEYYLDRRARQGFNGALMSVLPILHDRSANEGGLAPFDEDLVRSGGSWKFDDRFFSRLRGRLDMAERYGIVCGLVLLWVNYVEETWGAERTPGFVIPEGAREDYLSSLGEVVRDGECLLVVSGDAAFTSAAEVRSYRQFTEAVRAKWPKSLITFHSAPTAELPAELEHLADALVFQSGHHGETAGLARELSARYRAIAGARPVMNAEPAYEAHRVGGGVGRFGRSTVRRRIWESVAGGASAGVTYGAHGLWGWHRGNEAFSSLHFSGTPLDWRKALLLPGSDDAATCRAIMEPVGAYRLDPGSGELAVADEGWGADEVVVGVDANTATAVVYLPNGGPVTLRGTKRVTLKSAIDLETGHEIKSSVSAAGENTVVVDPPGTVSDAVLILQLG